MLISANIVKKAKSAEEPEVVKTTPRHEFYVVDKGWIRAYELEVGDVLVSTINGDMEITKIEHKYHDEEKHYEHRLLHRIREIGYRETKSGNGQYE